MYAASARRTNLTKTRFPCSPVNCLRWLALFPICSHWAAVCPCPPEEDQREAFLQALLRDAPEEPQLQWRDFGFRGLLFTDELTPLLLRLPLLERLDADLAFCTRFDFLIALTRLVSLTLSLEGIEADAWNDLLAVCTSDGLTRLHTLDLWDGPCSSDDLVQMLFHTPSLTSLEFTGMELVTSLSFFRRLPLLARSLTQLTLDCHTACAWSAADLQPLLMLQQLRELRLFNWPAEEPHKLTDEDRAPFEQRPCAVLPHLEVFKWTT
jgi:hypothetical protein